MDFNEINKLNIDKTSIAKKGEKKPKKAVPEIQKQEPEENSPANPSYWQYAVGVNKSVSFKAIDFSKIHILTDEVVDDKFFDETVETLKNSINDVNTQEINTCLERAKTISKHGKRALKNYIDIISDAFKYTYPSSRKIEMTNLLFDKIPIFSSDCVESLKEFFNEIDYTDYDGYELVKDCINAVLSDNSDKDSKMAWIAYHMPINYEPRKETASLVVDYRDNYPVYSKFIKHFDFGFMQKDISKMNISTERMKDLNYLMDNNEIDPKTLYRFAHSFVYKEENEWYNSGSTKNAANKVIDMICDDKEKLEVFKELSNLYPKKLCFYPIEMNNMLKTDSSLCKKLIVNLKTRPDDLLDAPFFVKLFDLIDESNIDCFSNNTIGMSEREAYTHAKENTNPKTKKYDAKIFEYCRYLKNEFNMTSYQSLEVAKECIDMQTGEFSPVAESFMHLIKRDEKSMKNLLMSTGFIMTKQLSMLHHIETSSDRATLRDLIKSLKNNDGHFEEKNLQYLQKILLSPTDKKGSLGENFRALPEIMNSIKDENGIVDKNKYLFFKKIATETKSYAAANVIIKAMKKFPPEKVDDIYSTIMSMKISKYNFASTAQEIIKYVYDEEGNKNQERFDFIKGLMENKYLFNFTGAFFNMCNDSEDNVEFVKEITKYASESYSIPVSSIALIHYELKNENKEFPEDVKKHLLDFAKNQIPLQYFSPLYNACTQTDEKTGKPLFNTELFNKTMDFMSIESKTNKNHSNLSPEIYIGIITNTLDIKSLKFKEKVHTLNSIMAADKYNKEHGIDGYEYFTKLISDLNDNINATKNFMPVDDKSKNDFIHNTLYSTNLDEYTPFERIISDSIPELEKMTDGIKIKYSRKDFLKDLSKICNENPSAKDIIAQKTGIELLSDNDNRSEYNITGYNGLISLDELNQDDKTEKIIYDCMHKFMYDNEVQTGNKKLDSQLNYIIKAFPEFINTIGKKQHGTQKYTLDVHQLLVMAYAIDNPEYLNSLNSHDKAVLKLSALFHDIMKQENVVDKGHQYPSSLYARSIIQKVVKNPENIDRIYEMINNHHWLGLYAHSNDKEKLSRELAFNFRRPNDFEIAKIMADSDLKAVSENFYNDHKSALKDSSINYIAQNLDKIYANGNALFTDYIVAPSKLNNHIEEKDGKKYKVINFHNISSDTDLSEYGFDSGITKDDLYLLVHMVDSNNIYSSLNTVKLLTSPINGGVLSESVITPKYQRTYCNRKYGVLLSHINTNIINENKHNQGSGREKDMSNIMSLIYDLNLSRLNFRKGLLNFLGIDANSIKDEEYISFYKNVLASKTSLSQINPLAEYSIGKYKFSGEKLINALETYQDALVDKTGSEHNEIVGYIPKIQGVIAKANSLSQVPDELLNFAQDNSLPVILI